jgi:hypothetical protein
MFAPRPTLLVSLAVVVLMATLSTPARAQGDGRKRADAGAKAYEVGDYTAAIDAFRDAYALSRDPALLFNIAQSYYMAGERQEALDYYRMYLERSPGAANQKEVEDRITELERPAVPRPQPRPPEPRVTMVERPVTQPATVTAPPDDNIDAILARKRTPRLGGIVRADIDAKTGGAAYGVGASLGLAQIFEIGLHFMVGNAPGIQGSGSLVLGHRRIRPLVTLSVPIFFEDGVSPGGGVSVGARLVITERLGLRTEIGVVHFLSVPPTYRDTVVVGTVGIEGWL